MALGRTSRVMATACLVTFSIGLSMAQTGDGQTPANEGVCDELMSDGITRGLYGLCVAYCEAQDCEGDALLNDECVPSSEKVLATYDRLKGAADPDMPCIQAPCPCWSIEELTSIDAVQCINTTTLNIVADGGFDTVARAIDSPYYGLVCSYQSNDPTMPVNRLMYIDEQEFAICAGQIANYEASLGLVCP